MLNQQKCLVIGAGGQSRVVLSLIQEVATGYFPVGIIDENYREGEEILSIPVVGSINLLEKYYEDGVKSVFLAIGDNFRRGAMFDLVKAIGFEFPNIISSKANVSPTAKLGQANVICPFSNIGPLVNIGDNNLINTHSTIEHESEIGNHCHIAPMTVVSGKTQLGDYGFLGAGTTIIDNVSIASKTLVAAGSVIVKNIDEPGYLYAGAPAERKKKI